MMLPGQIGWLNLKVGFDFIIIIIVITFDTIYARLSVPTRYGHKRINDKLYRYMHSKYIVDLAVMTHRSHIPNCNYLVCFQQHIQP